ncbi:hypothetical protein EB796_013183 [Bugula neritina]|uniref:CXXC-type domain-containing protein n=1 Tax=Bugula neritina TaxID=10212 RepID=A0A7J7JR63_BUGNE|nr:hypothetical protein EB796_013183 [Bugula neritina]
MSPSFDVMMRGLADVGAETPDMTESLLEETDQVSEIHKDVSEKHKDVSSDEDLFPVRRKVTTPKLDKAAYQDMLKVEASAVRKLPNCGECVMCLDKPQFGGKNKKKQMCQVKKKELQQRLARMERENNMEGQSAGSDSEEEAISSRLSSNKRNTQQAKYFVVKCLQ